MLNFIGCGSAFNTELGNNGAFIKKNSTLFMIDCGNSTFERIMKANLLDDVERIVVLLTHTYSDHIGSLGDLIFYSYYSIGEIGDRNLLVFSPYELHIESILESMGVSRGTYYLYEFGSGELFGYHSDGLNIKFEAISVNHVKNLNSFGYIIYYAGKKIYYSGDCYEIPKYILNKLNNFEFDYFYQDTCKADYEGNVHLSLRKLNEVVRFNVRDRVYCMHLDKGFTREDAYGLGFRVVNPII